MKFVNSQYSLEEWFYRFIFNAYKSHCHIDGDFLFFHKTS